MVVKEKLVYYPINEAGEAIVAQIHDDSIWLSTEDIATLYDTPLHIIIRQIKMIYTTDSMSEFLTMHSKRVKLDGRERIVSYYNLQMIVAIGHQLQAMQLASFYKWALQQLKD